MISQKLKGILVLDSDTRFLESIAPTLKKTSLLATSFTNPLKALYFYERHFKDYSVVLAGIRLPEMNGFSFARRIVAINPKAQVFLLTTFHISKTEVATVLPSTKVAGFVQRPILEQTLLGMLEV